MARHKQNLFKVLARPRYWPRGFRRLFLLTLPASIIILPVLVACALIFVMMSEIGRGIARFWNAPQKHRHSYGYSQFSSYEPTARGGSARPTSSELNGQMPVALLAAAGLGEGGVFATQVSGNDLAYSRPVIDEL